MRHGHLSPIRSIPTAQRNWAWRRWFSRRSEPTGKSSSFTRRRTTPLPTRRYLRFLTGRHTAIGHINRAGAVGGFVAREERDEIGNFLVGSVALQGDRSLNA